MYPQPIHHQCSQQKNIKIRCPGGCYLSQILNINLNTRVSHFQVKFKKAKFTFPSSSNWLPKSTVSQTTALWNCGAYFKSSVLSTRQRHGRTKCPSRGDRYIGPKAIAFVFYCFAFFLCTTYMLRDEWCWNLHINGLISMHPPRAPCNSINIQKETYSTKQRISMCTCTTVF